MSIKLVSIYFNGRNVEVPESPWQLSIPTVRTVASLIDTYCRTRRRIFLNYELWSDLDGIRRGTTATSIG